MDGEVPLDFDVSTVGECDFCSVFCYEGECVSPVQVVVECVD